MPLIAKFIQADALSRDEQVTFLISVPAVKEAGLDPTNDPRMWNKRKKEKMFVHKDSKFVGKEFYAILRSAVLGAAELKLDSPKNFDVLVADTLQRWNLQGKEQVRYDNALRAGEVWIAYFEDVIRDLQKKELDVLEIEMVCRDNVYHFWKNGNFIASISLTRWDDYIKRVDQNGAHQDKKVEMHALIENDSDVRNSFNLTKSDYMHRHPEALEENVENYLLEEYSAFFLNPKGNVYVYPGKSALFDSLSKHWDGVWSEVTFQKVKEVKKQDQRASQRSSSTEISRHSSSYSRSRGGDESSSSNWERTKSYRDRDIEGLHQRIDHLEKIIKDAILRRQCDLNQQQYSRRDEGRHSDNVLIAGVDQLSRSAPPTPGFYCPPNADLKHRRRSSLPIINSSYTRSLSSKSGSFTDPNRLFELPSDTSDSDTSDNDAGAVDSSTLHAWQGRSRPYTSKPVDDAPVDDAKGQKSPGAHSKPGVSLGR